jgi:serine protease Do
MDVLRKVAAALALLGLVLAAGNSYGAETRVPASSAEVRLSYAPLVKKAAPAVVNIYTKKVVRTTSRSPLFDDPFFQQFFGLQNRNGGVTRERIQNSLGSGVIVTADGLMVTNNHVIEGADEIRVVLADRREFSAAVVGTDERTDLAVLRLQDAREKLPFLEFRDSDEIEVGDLVLAIGNPFGVGQTVTSGIVSAVARTQSSLSDYQAFIQTDAAINPGNSGGALITMDGRLAGINTAIFSRSGGSQGIGFAIPSNMVRAVMSSIAKVGHSVRPWLGAEGQPVTGEVASSLGLRTSGGVLINTIHKGSPAARAGLQVGDVITALRGQAVDDEASLRYRLATLPLEGSVELTIVRKGNQARKVNLPLEAPPEVPARDLSELSGNNPLAGAIVANMSPALSEELALDSYQPGVIVLKIQQGSLAARMRFQLGDMVLAVNNKDVATVKDLAAALKTPSSNGWRITIRRGGQTVQMVLNR